MSTNGSNGCNGQAPGSAVATLTRARGRRLDRRTLGRRVCERMSEGELVAVVCEDLGIDRRTPWRWTQEDPAFAAEYQTAREMQAHALAEQVVRIADGGDRITQLYQWAAETEYAQLLETEPHAAPRVLAALDNSRIQRDRLRMDARRFLVAKIAPRLYGRLADETDEGDGTEGGSTRTEYIIVRRDPKTAAWIATGTEHTGPGDSGRPMSDDEILSSVAATLRDRGAKDASGKPRTIDDVLMERAARRGPTRFTLAITDKDDPINGPLGRLNLDEKTEHLVRVLCEQPGGREKILDWIGGPSVVVIMPDNHRDNGSQAPAAASPAAVFAALSVDEQRSAIVALCDQQGADWLRALLDVEEPNDG